MSGRAGILRLPSKGQVASSSAQLALRGELARIVGEFSGQIRGYLLQFVLVARLLLERIAEDGALLHQRLQSEWTRAVATRREPNVDRTGHVAFAQVAHQRPVHDRGGTKTSSQGAAQTGQLLLIAVGEERCQGVAPLRSRGASHHLVKSAVHNRREHVRERTPPLAQVHRLRAAEEVGTAAPRQDQRVGHAAAPRAALHSRLEVSGEKRARNERLRILLGGEHDGRAFGCACLDWQRRTALAAQQRARSGGSHSGQRGRGARCDGRTQRGEWIILVITSREVSEGVRLGIEPDLSKACR
mmetsp:Transcript_40908/g.103043  ORF Transcript_40908/g.103043 Transcript_40908/m.103043 type:complete len:300 (-) Transcript_40908:1945-2844(-)